jgi:hypothetical protein
VTVHFLASELSRWDAVPEGQSLALTFFSDERPLRGAAGLADWRLCGRLSRLIKAGRIAGTAGEVTMVAPSGGRLAFDRVFLFGMGAQAGFGEAAFRAATRRIRDVMANAGAARYAVQPPGRATGLVAPRRALELWQEEAAADGREGEVTLIESPSGQKEMSEALRGRR